MDKTIGFPGRYLARFLQKTVQSYETRSVFDTHLLKKSLKPGDVLLVEGNLRISVAIKYLTQSTWSHAALYIGDAANEKNNDEELDLIEADLIEGVIAVPLSKYANLNTRICRPVHLRQEDLSELINFMLDSRGKLYDLKNVIDLARYLFPTPPVPASWRRNMLAFGSGDPTRAICSTLLAQAFQKIRYPILPEIERIKVLASCGCSYTEEELLHIRHHSLFTPRDFDLSPYFELIKPSIENDFDYKKLNWAT